MRKVIVAMMVLALAACSNTKLVPIVSMPDPPAELMQPPPELKTIPKQEAKKNENVSPTPK